MIRLTIIVDSYSPWPHIQGFFADASAKCGRTDLFNKEFLSQTENALRSGHFAEIYHSITGEVYGGLQESKSEGIRYWESQPWQTWSATAYLRNIFLNIFGMQFGTDGISFSPVVTNLFYKGTLSGLKYRNALLNITIRGNGSKTQSFKINDIESRPFVPSTAEGICNIEIILTKEDESNEK